MKINAKQEIQNLEIDKSLNSSGLDLSNKLLACFNEAIHKSQALAAEKTKQITGLNIPGL
jgi:DNA-binding protein YbaB